MPPRAASWYGERCKFVIRKLRAEPKPAPAVRSVTVLGATGSIGIEHRRSAQARQRPLPGRGGHRATQRRGSWRKLARELNARFAVVADPSAYRELKDALSGTGIEAGERRGRR